eukprot:scaffold75351_cov31-Tisochrysis_lutea.AAC.3
MLAMLELYAPTFMGGRSPLAVRTARRRSNRAVSSSWHPHRQSLITLNRSSLLYSAPALEHSRVLVD